MKVKLQDIADAIDLQNEEVFGYFNKKTGEIYHITHEDIKLVEEERFVEDMPDWQKEVIESTKEILENREGVYIPLPSKFDFHEWEKMRNFALQLEDGEMREPLYDAIHGSGAFRRFKALIHEFGIEEDWFRYRDQALRDLARRWCEAKGIEYEE